MELQEFISESLINIASGIKNAQAEVRDCGGVLNPAYRMTSQNKSEDYAGSIGTGQNIFMIEFNVSVTVNEEKTTDTSGKVNVANVISVGSKSDSNYSNVATQKISFKVPFAFPIDEVSQENFKNAEFIRAKSSATTIKRTSRNNKFQRINF